MYGLGAQFEEEIDCKGCSSLGQFADFRRENEGLGGPFAELGAFERSSEGLGDLGFELLPPSGGGGGFGFQDAFDMAAQFDPTGTSQMASTLIHAFQSAEAMLGIGKGRNEADVIVPLQNEVGARLAAINNTINTSSIPMLQAMHNEVEQIGQYFHNFVNDSQKFPDGRASTQALNTIMPLIDGTNSSGAQVRPDRGTLGSIERRIVSMGGTVPPPLLTQGYGSGIPNLQFPLQNYPYIPQAGTLPPNSPLSPLRSSLIPEVGGGLFSGIDLKTVAIVGALAYFAIGRRR